MGKLGFRLPFKGYLVATQTVTFYKPIYVIVNVVNRMISFEDANASKSKE